MGGSCQQGTLPKAPFCWCAYHATLVLLAARFSDAGSQGSGSPRTRAAASPVPQRHSMAVSARSDLVERRILSGTRFLPMSLSYFSTPVHQNVVSKWQQTTSQTLACYAGCRNSAGCLKTCRRKALRTASEAFMNCHTRERPAAGQGSATSTTAALTPPCCAVGDYLTFSCLRQGEIKELHIWTR